MSLVLETRGVSELDVDYSRATQLSTIGSLADAVLRELIAIELGKLGPDQLVAVPQAAKIFRLASIICDMNTTLALVDQNKQTEVTTNRHTQLDHR